jgi:site-specific DNA-cytosine methylase
MLHNMAAMRPWVLVSENVEAQRNIHNGTVWELITGVLRILGYTVQPVPVCPSQ